MSEPAFFSSAQKGSYIHRDKNSRSIFDLENISQNALVTSHKKQYIKTSGLSYFSKTKKFSKICDYSIELTEIKADSHSNRKKLWSCFLWKIFYYNLAYCLLIYIFIGHGNKSCNFHMYEASTSSTHMKKHFLKHWMDINSKHKVFTSYGIAV